MREELKAVKTGGKKVGEVSVPIYENVDELIENEEEERILTMFNMQNAIRIMGNERAKHTLARVGKKRRFEIAYNLLWSMLSPEETDEVIGNVEKLQAVIASERVQKAVDEFIEKQKAELEAQEA